MKDFFNQTLAVGDTVAFIPNGYRDLVRGRITAFTPKQVRIAFTNTWNYGTLGLEEETLRYPSVVVKDCHGGWGDVVEQDT
jgi:hypothetical protein